MKLYWLIISVVGVLQAAGQQDSTARTATTSAAVSTTTTSRIPTTSTTALPSTTTTSSPSTTTSTSTTPSTTTTSSILPSTITSSTSSTTTSSTTTSSLTSTEHTASTQLSSTTAASTTSSTPTSTPTFGNHSTSSSLSGGAIAGIVVGCVAALALLAVLACCCLKKRRRHLQDEDYLKSTNYADEPPTEMKQQVGDAPVSGFSPAAAYRQQYSAYPQSEDQFEQQDFTRQRSMRHTASPYGQQYYQEQSPFETPHMREGQYIGHPSDRYEDPSTYQNPNTPTSGTFNSSHGAGAGTAAGVTAAGLAAIGYSHGQQGEGYDQQQQYDGQQHQYDGHGQYDQYNDGDVGDSRKVYNDQYEGEASSSSQQQHDQAHSLNVEREEPQSLPPPHGLGNRWDLYNYAYTPPSTSP